MDLIRKDISLARIGWAYEGMVVWLLIFIWGLCVRARIIGTLDFVYDQLLVFEPV